MAIHGHTDFSIALTCVGPNQGTEEKKVEPLSSHDSHLVIGKGKQKGEGAAYSIRWGDSLNMVLAVSSKACDMWSRKHERCP